jgi:Na+-translocating ferredoxin:NAD+ oxidoreductase RnfD subunit
MAFEGNATIGIAFLAGALAVADFTAKACSSPQTQQLNAKAGRAETSQKWVNIGLLEGIAFVVVAAVIDPRNRMAFLAGGALEAAVTWYEYSHATQAGLADTEPPTEDWSGNGVYEYSQA